MSLFNIAQFSTGLLSSAPGIVPKRRESAISVHRSDGLGFSSRDLECWTVVGAMSLLLQFNNRINELPDHLLRTLNIDAGSMRARRIIDDMIASEMRNAAA